MEMDVEKNSMDYIIDGMKHSFWVSILLGSVCQKVGKFWYLEIPYHHQTDKDHPHYHIIKEFHESGHPL